MYKELSQAIFKIKKQSDFKHLALEVYSYQYKRNKLYHDWANLLGKTPDRVKELTDLPFLPISMFKNHKISSTERPTEKTFYSSGTTGNQISKHFVSDLALYEKSFTSYFETCYPNHQDTAIIALLPSYLERDNSSLIYMVNHLLKTNRHPMSGFHLQLDANTIDFLVKDKAPKLLIGVTFALLDLAEKGLSLNNTTIIETGGMKGRRKEMIREELHQILFNQLNAKAVHSEYGMTELLSQAYLNKDHFETPAWMQVFCREISDPLTVKTQGKGALNIIDLANINSCSFIATDDLAQVHHQQLFDVNGRIDHSQIRGCNLLV